MMRKGPATQGAIRRLLTHKQYTVEMVHSIIKETDLNPCADQTTEDLGALGLFDLSRHQEIENKERVQYKEALCTLNEELTSVNAKLKEKSCLREEAEKVRAALAAELLTFREQMDKAKADTVMKFRASQNFIDACGVYYGDRFDDYLKQVGFIYPDLDLSKFTLNDPVPTTPRGGDTVNEESDDSIHIEKQGPKDDGVVIAKLVPTGTVAPLVLSAKDPSTQDAVNPFALDAPPA
nr:hypothetical protein CFP56_17656 [Quercus suber]